MGFKDLPGGPVVRTPRFRCRGPRFSPRWRNQDPTSWLQVDKESKWGAEESYGCNHRRPCRPARRSQLCGPAWSSVYRSGKVPWLLPGDHCCQRGRAVWSTRQHRFSATHWLTHSIRLVPQCILGFAIQCSEKAFSIVTVRQQTKKDTSLPFTVLIKAGPIPG